MPNTANYSFPTPADTDLVKNGADAIRDLGDAVDTAMNTALGTKKSGLVLLNTTSFSGVASQSINDVFSATYDSYRILINQYGTAAGQLRFRYRVSGTDNSATNYRQQIFGGDGSLAFAGRDTGLTFHLPGRTKNGVSCISIFDVINPFPSTLRAQQVGSYNDNTDGSIAAVSIASQLDVGTSYTGFTILAESGNMTGKVSVYGYNQ
jgi:hypothetical protein